MSINDAQLLAKTFQNMADMFSSIVDNCNDGEHHRVCITTSNYIRSLFSSFLEINLYGTMPEEEIDEWEQRVNSFLDNDPVVGQIGNYNHPSWNDVHEDGFYSSQDDNGSSYISSSDSDDHNDDEYKELENYILENEDTYQLLNMAPTKTKDIHITIRKNGISLMTIAGQSFHNKYKELWKDIVKCKDDRYYKLFGLVGPPHYTEPLCIIRSNKECFFPLHTKWKQDINDLKQRLVTILGITCV